VSCGIALLSRGSKNYLCGLSDLAALSSMRHICVSANPTIKAPICLIFLLPWINVIVTIVAENSGTFSNTSSSNVTIEYRLSLLPLPPVI